MTINESQRRIHGILKEDELLRYFGVGVVLIDEGDAAAEIDHALNNTGLCVAVRMCEWQPESSAAKNAVGNATVVVGVGEVTGLNRAQPNPVCGQDVAEYVAWLLNMAPVDAGRSVLSLSGKISSEPAAGGTVTTMAFTFKHQLSNTLKALRT